MHIYQHFPLDSSLLEIRLATILPGRFDDPIRIGFKLATLRRPVPQKATRVSLKKIRQTLPPNWTAFNVEGRILFSNYNGHNMTTSWIHPDATVDRNLYDPQDSDIGFKALSYTWGAPGTYTTAAIENSTPFSQATSMDKKTLLPQNLELPIGRNLAEAIQHLRYEHDERTMWIDAICINQSDTSEKSMQVPLMSRIYSLAQRVVAWLGPEVPTTELGFRNLDYLGHQLYFSKGYFLPSPNATEPNWYMKSFELPFGVDVWAAIFEVFSREWFKRVWVLQGIQLGPPNAILHCGRHQILWSVFARPATRIHYSPGGKLKDAGEEVRTRVTEMCRSMREQSFEGIMGAQHRKACSDPRDRVYGIMSLAPSEIVEAIRTDYTQSVPEIYKQACLVMIEHSRRLEILTHRPRTRHFDAPSWVPDWSQCPQQTISRWWPHAASGSSASRAKYVNDDKLEVVVRRIAKASVITELDGSLDAVIKYLSGLGTESLQNCLYPATGETRFDSWAWTFVRGQLDSEDTLFPNARGDNYLRFHDYRDILLRMASGNGTEEDKRRLNRSWEGVAGTYHIGRQVFVTEDGHMGLSAHKIREGDEVFIILGCSVPIILRPGPTTNYRIIGDVYVHGLIDGEGLLGPIPPPWRPLVTRGSGGGLQRVYFNTETEVRITEDPRLVANPGGPLPPDWTFIPDGVQTRDDGLHCYTYRNERTGDVLDSDPRLLPEILIANGHELQTITII